MSKKESISEISFRANIIHKKALGKEIAIYEDHRTILNVIYYLKQKRNIDDSLDIYMFDYHDDYCHPKEEAINKIQDFLKDPSIEKLYPIIEFDLRHLDDDWVKAGMELGFINNVFLFNHNVKNAGDIEKYETKKFGTKTLYYLGNVWDALGSRGILNDPLKFNDHDVLNDFGWIKNESKYSFKPNRKFILDFDLDCFSAKVLDKTIAIPSDILIEKFEQLLPNTYHYAYTSKSFLQNLIKECEIVTMCYENDYCGGIRQSQKIFNTIDHILFEGELGG